MGSSPTTGTRKGEILFGFPLFWCRAFGADGSASLKRERGLPSPLALFPCRSEGRFGFELPRCTRKRASERMPSFWYRAFARMDPLRSLCRVLTKIPRPITLLFFTLCFFLQRHLRSGRGDAGVDAPFAVLFISRPGEVTCAVAIRHNIWYYLFYGCTLSCENFALSFRQNRLDRMCVNDQSL